MLDIGTDNTMMSPLKHNHCIYRAYSLVEEIDINTIVIQIDVNMAMLKKRKKYLMPSLLAIGDSGLV